MSDPDDLRASSREGWEASAAGWERRQGAVRRWAAPVSHALVEAIDPQPGQTVLELAAGVGETGFLAAELIRPGGRLICSDQSPAMLAAARRRAEELDLAGVQVDFSSLDAEWIDLPLASVDAVLCRWGLMLVVDRDAALRECRRVLRPDGRLAAAVWGPRAANPWLAVLGDALLASGLTAPPEHGAPHAFALSEADLLASLVAGAGFQDVEVLPVALEQRLSGVADYWESQLDLSPSARMIRDAGSATIDFLREEVARRLEPYTAADGTIVLPGLSLVVSAVA